MIPQISYSSKSKIQSSIERLRLATLVKGSQEHIYYTLLKILNEENQNLNDDQVKLLQNIDIHSDNFRNIEFRSLILEFERLCQEPETKENQVKRQKHMQMINDKFLNLQFKNKVQIDEQFDFQNAEETQTKDEQGNRQYKSKLDKHNVSLNTYLQKAYKIENLDKFSIYALRQLDFDQILKCNDQWIYEYLNILASSKALEGLDFLIPLFQRLIKGQFRLGLIFAAISLQQMEELSKLYENMNNNIDFITHYYEKRFNSKIVYDQDPFQQKDHLQQVDEWQKTLPKQFQFQSLIYINQLSLNAKQSSYDINLYIQYLEMPLKNYPGINPNIRDSLINNKFEFNPIFIPFDHDQIIYQHLEYFINQEIELGQIENYFEEQYLKKTLALLYLYSGKVVPDINSILTENEILKLQNEKLIEFDESTKQKKFKHGESVKLLISFKNIPQVSIKVFQINTLNYYLQGGPQNFLDLNLKGLIPKMETFFDFSQNFSPAQKILKEIEFPEISQLEQGIFIIDFYGNGISSRALIQKGNLQLRQKKIVSSGYCFEILNENLEVCCSDTSGLWLDKQFYRIDKERKEIMIPFGRTSQEHKVIVVHEGFANLQSIKIESESYNLKCTGIISEESMIIGNQAKIFLFPKLFGTSNIISLKLLQSIAISITILNEEMNPTVFTFDNVKFEDHIPYEIEIPITKFIQIQIQITAQIQSMINLNQFIDLKENYSILFEEQLDTEQFDNQYLYHSEDEGYSIYVLGKGGEPKKNVKLELSFSIQHYHSYDEIFQTDENGRIKLGFLENVEQICSQPLQSQSINNKPRYWAISCIDTSNIPNKINVLAGQKITLPICIEKDKILLQKTHNNQVINSLSQLCVLKKNQLSFTLNEPGNYELILMVTNNSIVVTIQIFEGKQQQDSDAFISKKSLILDSQLSNLVSIHNVSKMKEEQTTKITGLVCSNRPVILFALVESFYTSSIIIGQQIEHILQSKTKEEFQIYQTYFQSLTNTQISDEEQYVENRKKQENFIGITLEKPKLLLNRQLIRECKNETEQLKDEKIQQPQTLLPANQRNKQNFWLSGDLPNLTSIFCRFDFLKYPGKLITLDINEIKENEEDREFSFEVPNYYSKITICALNDFNYSLQEVYLSSCGISTRSLEHQTNLKIDKCYNISRNSQALRKGESIFINDVTATQFKIIDSLEKLFRELISLNNNGKNLREKDLQNWEFLVKWNLKTLEQKHQLYDEYQSDELNLFLSFKDSPYFEVYVLNYIRSKIEKNLIDHFLCQDDSELESYLSINAFNNLNLIEQILLLIHFQERKQNKIQSYNIYSYLKQNFDTLAFDQNQLQRLFDTILTSQEAEEFRKNNINNQNNCFSPQIINQRQSIVQGLPHPPPPPLSSVGLQNLGGPPPPPGGCIPCPPPPGCSLPQNSSEINEKRKRQEIAVFYSKIIPNDRFQLLMNNKINKDDEHYNKYRNQYIQNYKNVEKTKEYGERHSFYYKDQNIPIKLNKFFIDLVEYSFNQGIVNTSSFITPEIIHYTTFSEFVFILSILDLPFQNIKQNYNQFQAKGMQIVAKTNLIYYSQEIKEVDVKLRNDILITQLFFDEQNKRQEFLASKEFLTNHIYGSLIIVSNFSNENINAQIFVEIPNGAIPIKTPFYSKSINISCKSLSTERYSYYWYFPKEGTFTIYPASLTIFDRVVAVSKPQQFNVVNFKVNPNLEVIEDILGTGNKANILKFLETKNIFDEKIFKPSQISDLFEDKDFYQRVLKIYRDKKFKDSEILKYAVYHADLEGLKDFFQQNLILDKFNSIKYFKCSLFEISNIKMLEYYPLITKRIHKLKSDEQGILNVELRNQYKNYLQYLVEKPVHSTQDKLVFSYYLLLQERISEAIQVFSSIQLPINVGNSELQYDYFSAYFDFYEGYPNFQEARRICEKYLNYPVIYWRNLFYDIANLLAEFDGDDDEKDVGSRKNQNQQQKQLALKEETLSCDIQGKKISLTYSNLKQATIIFYKFNQEILFSIDPFQLNNSKDFSIIKSNHEINVRLESAEEGEIYKQEIEIPQHLQKDNLYIQVNGINKKCFQTYSSNELIVNVMENSGQLKICDLSGKYLSKVYVKVYVKQRTGESYFYKDGYTDLRGRFDYVSLNSEEVSQAQSFAILIQDEQNGSVVKQVLTPSLIGKYENDVKLVSTLWQQKAQNYKVNNISKKMP